MLRRHCLGRLGAWSAFGLMGWGAPVMAGVTELHHAAQAGDVARLRVLLAAGAALDARDARGRTPLLLATAARQLEAARVLIDAGADVNLPDGQGVTALAHACQRGQQAMAELLQAAGGR